MSKEKDSLIDRKIVLRVNRAREPIGLCSPKEAFVSMMDRSEPNTFAIHIEYALNEEGDFDFSSPTVFEEVEFDLWKELDARPFDKWLGTASGRIRIPTVIVSKNCKKMPVRRPKFSSREIWKRDGGRCQYTGKVLSREEGNIDHIVPRAKGGETSWENCVLSDAKFNTKKGDKLPHEIGVKAPKPKRPSPQSLSELTKEKASVSSNPDWKWFL